MALALSCLLNQYSAPELFFDVTSHVRAAVRVLVRALRRHPRNCQNRRAFIVETNQTIPKRPLKPERS